MWSNRIKIISSIFIALCLILCFSAVPVNADSNQSNAGAFPPQRSGPPIGFKLCWLILRSSIQWIEIIAGLKPSQCLRVFGTASF